tara:strand:+ start:49 stop:1434 length:1386 start_codon:yes stop_codon:yes gene_type:complete
MENKLDTNTSSGLREVDLIIKNAYIATVNSSNQIFKNGSIVIDQSKILRVGLDSSNYRAKRTIDARGALVHPGFIDNHIHLNYHGLRWLTRDGAGWNEALPLHMKYMEIVNQESEYMSSMLAMLEMVKNGTTAFLESGGIVNTDAAAEAATNIGIRTFLGDAFIRDQDANGVSVSTKDKDKIYNLLGTELARNRDGNGLVQAVISLSGMGKASDDLLLMAKEMADASGVILNMHQSYQENDYIEDNNRLGIPPMVHYDNIGLLDSNCMFAHVNCISDMEVRPILDSKLSIAWCPMASMLFGLGGTIKGKHLELFKNGINISFGCDSANWTSAFDIGEQAFIALLTAREKTGDPSALIAEEILRIATINGSKALRKESEFGSIEIGKRADLVIRKNTLPESLPGFDPLREVMVSSRSKSIDTVIINGDIVVENGYSTKLDEDEFANEFRVFHQKLIANLEKA